MAKQTNTEKFYGQGINVTTNAQQVLTNISNMIRKIKDEAENLSEWSARELVKDARDNLSNSGYATGRLLRNITFSKQKKGYYTVSIVNNSDKDTMYYLEYGTGFVGEGTMADPKGRIGKPHAWAKSAHWEYAIGPEIIYSDKPDGKDGWFYEQDGKWNFTSGLRSIAYMYNAFNNFNQPNGAYERALARTKIKSILKAGK